MLAHVATEHKSSHAFRPLQEAERISQVSKCVNAEWQADPAYKASQESMAWREQCNFMLFLVGPAVLCGSPGFGGFRGVSGGFGGVRGGSCCMGFGGSFRFVSLFPGGVSVGFGRGFLAACCMGLVAMLAGRCLKGPEIAGLGCAAWLKTSGLPMAQDHRFGSRFG